MTNNDFRFDALVQWLQKEGIVDTEAFELWANDEFGPKWTKEVEEAKAKARKKMEEAQAEQADLLVPEGMGEIVGLDGKPLA